MQPGMHAASLNTHATNLLQVVDDGWLRRVVHEEVTSAFDIDSAIEREIEAFSLEELSEVCTSAGKEGGTGGSRALQLAGLQK